MEQSHPTGHAHSLRQVLEKMSTMNQAFFHKLYGAKKPRVHYYDRDFLDYTLMVAISAVAVGLAYGVTHVMAIAGFALCAFMLIMFAKRHGVQFTVPLL